MSANRTTRIRHQLTRDVGLGEQFRDAQQALDSIAYQLHRTVEMLYAEPMTLGGFEQRPDAIEAIRVVDMAAQETPVTDAGGVAHFVWKPRNGGAVIGSINGMTAAANGGKKYKFTFRITFTPRGGV